MANISACEDEFLAFQTSHTTRECRVCTVMNPRDITVCAVCDSEQDLDDDNSWLCTICTCRSACHLEQCVACAAAKPAPARKHPWSCRRCTFENTADALHCSTCGASPPTQHKCWVDGRQTTSPLHVKDDDCPHVACSLACLQRLESEWWDIKAELLDLEFPPQASVMCR